MSLAVTGCGGAYALDREVVSARDCPTAQLDHNEALARAVLEDVLGRGLIDENENIYHRDFVAHAAGRDVGRAEDRAAAEGWRKAAPDLRVTVLRVAAACDSVVAHFEASGVNTGEGNGLPATGRTFRVQGMTFFNVRDGQIAEEWTVFDQDGLLAQLGLLGE
ncbi:MAG: ester cyclase [Pseudomonadota bacterium]